MTLAIGSQAPDFSVPNHDNIVRTLADYAGRYLVLYFYPKDDTPGCTREAIGFTKLANEFSDKQAVVVGVSADSVASHQKFRDKHQLTVELLADETKAVCQAYGTNGCRGISAHTISLQQQDREVLPKTR